MSVSALPDLQLDLLAGLLGEFVHQSREAVENLVDGHHAQGERVVADPFIQGVDDGY